MITLNECVEKQFAKKPSFRARDCVKDYKCPRCGDLVLSKVDGAYVYGRRTNYCSECGQKLDWSY